ncbi:hypothetical protein [Bacteroides finegoldii]|uniref:Uncharacterized protein n=1 Tax=Bacteroides finegoldii TaxID=338188 RepID=A0A174JJF3_9BACE|nr:hypothetical protein [Bacteroides finegoldii]CUO97280.1 Uncharacterised protein [Bacteroides finegoldii]
MKLNKLPLNVIGLNRVGLNQIGSPSRRANTSDRPYIDPEVLASLVAVCICDGKSNDDPDRAVIKNLVDPDNPFIISNAAFKLNSGYGKYEEDFTDWIIYPNIKVTDSVITTDGNFKSSWFIYKHSSESKINEMNIKVSGIPKGGKILYIYISDETANLPIAYTIPKDGIYHLPESKINNNRASVGFTVESRYDWNNIRIEQIPSFEGAFVTDGKDDLITSTKTVKEMLGGSNEVTVVSMMLNLENEKITYTNQIRPFQNGYIRNNVISNTGGKYGIYGYKITDITDIFKNRISINDILGDRKDYSTDAGGTVRIDGKFSVEGYCFNDGTIGEMSQVAWYWTFISNKVLTTDQINQVISYFNLDKHVKPDIIYDTIRQSITNENHASFNDELVDFSGNGHNMKIYNSAWNKESGINDEGAWQTDGVSDYGNVENLPILKDYTVAIERRWITSPVDKNQCLAFKGHTNDWGAFACEFSNAGQLRSYTFSPSYNILQSYNEKSLVYQSKYSYSGTPIVASASIDGSTLRLCLPRGGFPFYANVAIKMFLLFPYSLSEFLIERQLKRYKLGTLYPDMVEFRPIVKSNREYSSISYSVNPGEYISVDSMVTITVTLSNTSDKLIDVSCNAISDISISGDNGVYKITGKVVKSPQKIDITIDEYIRYEDIVQPYPAIINLKQDGKTITWGDKLKVGSDIVFVGSANLLPELYTVSETRYNGVTLYPNTIIKVEKSMVFDNARTYLKANEPSCILSPNRLRIPNSSYKILGYIPDLTGKGNHGKLNNFAYAGMSGANGYVEDFTKWSKNSSLDDVEITYDRIKVNKLTRSTVLYVTSNKFINKIKIVASGIPNGGKLTFTQYPDNAIENNKEFEIGGVTTTGSWGFSIKEGLNLDWSNLVIQQIGEHEGSICFDGTDDHITISNIIGGKCIMAKVTVNRNSGIIYDQRRANVPNKSWMQLNPSSVIFEQNAVSTYIDGILNHNVTGSDLVSKTVNLTCELEIGDTSGTYQPTIGSSYAVGYTTNINLYEFMLFPDVPNEEEIKELNDVMGIENNIEVS